VGTWRTVQAVARLSNHVGVVIRRWCFRKELGADAGADLMGDRKETQDEVRSQRRRSGVGHDEEGRNEFASLRGSRPSFRARLPF
jgi:hypothetical protein